ncbi:MAG: TolC family protein, partial [Myxococcaceae bacterium]|nr:TolC family protein [Myxococcaceae bacterium]
RRRAFAQDALKDSRARVQARLVSSNDLTRAELELATAEREATRAEGDVQTAYLQLANLLNTRVEPPLAEPTALLKAAAVAHEELTLPLEPALARRLDLQALRSRAEGLEAAATEPGLRVLPSLNLLGQYRLTNEGGLTGRFGDGFVGVEMSWTLFDGGARYAEGRERDAQARATALEAQGLERSVGLQLERARVSLRNAQAALAQAEVAARAAEKNAKEAQALYREGLTGALQVADANIRLFEAQVALARERYGLALALLDVRAAAGLDPLGKELTL